LAEIEHNVIHVWTGLTIRSLHGDLNWRSFHSNGRMVAKDLTRTGSRPYGCYINLNTLSSLCSSLVHQNMAYLLPA